MTKHRKLNKIDMCGVEYKVVYSKGPGSKGRELDDNIVGQIDHDKRVINIEDGRSDFDFVLFHEMIHGAVEATISEPGSKMVEKYYGEGFVRPFSRFLWSMMKNAGLLKASA